MTLEAVLGQASGEDVAAGGAPYDLERRWFEAAMIFQQQERRQDLSSENQALSRPAQSLASLTAWFVSRISAASLSMTPPYTALRTFENSSG